MDKLIKVFMLLTIQLVTKSSYTTAQCTCSCSSLGQNQDTCDKSATPLDEQTSSDVSYIFFINRHRLTVIW